ncbi:nitrogenase [Phormidium tenue FACHB-886]|nr:nitrogenase [Phormidium tenue FACHB-886]
MTTDLTSTEQIGAVDARAARSPYTDAQISVWLRGLLTIAWADGHFDKEEQALITEITQNELAPSIDLGPVETIPAVAIAATFGRNTSIGENFMRTAVMVAIADGLYSAAEDEVLREFCAVLKLDANILAALRLTLNYQQPEVNPEVNQVHTSSLTTQSAIASPQPDHELLKPLQDWLDHLDVKDARLARFLCKMIPPQCPFERDVVLFGHKIVHIPPMCKLNPLYDQLVGLRFRALSYLADECHEDVAKYC